MSRETARIYERACQSEQSAEVAWRDIQQLAEEYDWDVERMLDW